MAAVSRSAFRLAGVSVLALAALTVAALAQQGPEPAQNYQVFTSHVEWRAQAVIERDAAQSNATWKQYNSHIAHTNNADWLPIMLPGEAEKIPGRVHPSSSACPALTC